MKNETPEYVTDALMQVRESGQTNMLNRKRVAELVDDVQAREWLEKASDSQYMTALNGMFDDEEGDPEDDEEEWEGTNEDFY